VRPALGGSLWKELRVGGAMLSIGQCAHIGPNCESHREQQKENKNEERRQVRKK